MITRFLFPLLGALLLAAPASADRILVAVAANFLTTAQDISALFEADTGHDVDLVHGSTGNLFAQIMAGAPYDVFLSADTERPARLAEAGRAATDGVKPYATGFLALVHGARTEPGTLDDILARDGLRIAIADPDIAPYGGAARDVLQEFRGAEWQRDLAYGESVGQAFAFVATGNADAGLVALSQALSYGEEIWVMEVPDDLHDPIYQDAVLLTRAAESAAAREFYDFLGSEDVTRILMAAGYEAPL